MGSSPDEASSRLAPDRADIATAARARAVVLERIGDACVRARRDPSGVRLVAVTKTVPLEQLQAAVAAGHEAFGENRVQEAETKAPFLPGLSWHLVGPLQSNKARRAVELFDMIETVDSLALAVRLDRLVREIRGLPAEGPVERGRRLTVLLQVNVDEDPGKAGFEPAGLETGLAAMLSLGALDVAGLMTVGRLVSEPEGARPTFRRLRLLSERLRGRVPGLGPALSMGMSLDYEVAVEEGATIVRVGQALFGPRPAH